jgi:hypothetical protein
MVCVKRTHDQKAVPESIVNLTMPVVDQSPTAVVSPDVTECDAQSIAVALSGVADPRRARGKRHGLARNPEHTIMLLTSTSPTLN